jgi:hypothetical protein
MMDVLVGHDEELVGDEGLEPPTNSTPNDLLLCSMF